jgi:hypothetical protein
LLALMSIALGAGSTSSWAQAKSEANCTACLNQDQRLRPAGRVTASCRGGGQARTRRGFRRLLLSAVSP